MINLIRYTASLTIMKRLGWKKEDAESRVKSFLPDVDDADEVVLIKQLMFPAPKDVY